MIRYQLIKRGEREISNVYFGKNSNICKTSDASAEINELNENKNIFFNNNDVTEAPQPVVKDTPAIDNTDKNSKEKVT